MELSNNPDFESVSLNLKQSVVLPQTVPLTKAVYRLLKTNTRTLQITKHDQQVPRALKDWMQSDYRYREWFDVEPEASVDAQIVEDSGDEIVTDDDPVDSVDTDSTEKSGEITEDSGSEIVTDDGKGLPEDTSLDDMSKDGLVAYAEKHGIEVKSSWNKPDIREAIDRAESD